MRAVPRLFRDQGGSSAVEFAILLPVWLMLFFGMLDYGWYLTNLIVLENAVAAGARAGVKVKYWLDENEGGSNPVAVAQETALASFWISAGLAQGNWLTATRLDENMTPLNDDELCSQDQPCAYLKVQVNQYPFSPLAGYLPKSLLPETLRASAISVFP